ncbi:CRISPR-associated helicase Cas3' [Streptomyces sp. H10-C2]|nr:MULTISPECIES: CRISPR-associated helicase Cas3' [unclassified Streptomyces]MDJ0346828.1 CRISPR-associated helicase Cas3' [Streptomyces sp. PH10-H1]MDJ0375347.1 CRISPR-associated helicase Cas3' [Streptomyces sp. H10-C2]
MFGLCSCIWGKSDELPAPYPLGCHSLDTAAVAMVLWDVHLSAGQRRFVAESFGVSQAHARRLVAFWAGLHDVGKCCPAFQSSPTGPDPEFLQREEFASPAGWMNEGSVRHERVAHLVLPSLLADLGYDIASRPGKSVAHQVAQILGGHHGVYGPMLDRTTMRHPERAEPRIGMAKGWQEQRVALVDVVHRACGSPAAPARVAPAGAAVLVTGLVVLADWIASGHAWVSARQRAWMAAGDEDWEAHFQRALAAAGPAVARLQLAPPRWLPASGFSDVFPHITKPYPLQVGIAARLPGLVSGPGILLVTAPTGDGKTETGLFGARLLGSAAGRPGLGVLLPSMATTDAMWDRVRAYVGRAAAADTPVTLLHGMAWLKETYSTDAPDTELCDDGVSTTAGDFVRRKHLGLAAGTAVGTWDQAAMACLPMRFNTLRWLGLSGKTLIIDEAHAYDAFGHALTIRLLQWLGHLGAPVVLLSATLAGSLAQRLVHAYLEGAGHTAPQPVAPAYPGWLFADAATGTITASGTIPSTRAHHLAVDQHLVRHTHDLSVDDGRAAQLAHILAPLYDSSADPGAVLVICNTVPDAQATYQALAARSGRSGTRTPNLLLLHARMPQWQREDLTRRLLALLGPRARRPHEPWVVVTTQVAEQSLDVDFDLVVTDLAPLAQLLQRAGRGHRHTLADRGRRPAWAPIPRLVVLAPAGELPPPAWGNVYEGALLRRTRDLLAESTHVAIPQAVTSMIETVYADLNALAEQALHDDHRRAGRDAAHAAAADTAAIPAPATITDLYPITDRDLDPGLLTTRLGADSARLLPVYRAHDGRYWLDPQCTSELPIPASGHMRLTRGQVADLARLSVPAPGAYLPERPDTAAPTEWNKTPLARELRLLPHRVLSGGGIQGYRTERHTLRLDPVLGLVRTPVR